MNKFVEGLKSEENKTYTENGCPALKSTSSSLVDLFGVIGALRSRTDAEIEKLFSKAFAEDKLLATKMSFYSRDIRDGGQGERRTPKVIWKFLANNYPDIMRKNIENVAYFGRFDDLYVLVGTPVEADMWAYMKNQINSDIKNMNEGKPVSLAAKWLKSCNASSKETVKLGKLTASHLGLSIPNYRRMLSKLRDYINVTEVKMSSNDWNNINYEQVPSKAMNSYRNAFLKHDGNGFTEYLSKLSKGEAKINASTLYPYDIVEKYMQQWGRGKIDPVLEEQWKALPNYVDGEENVLVMADVSGSMCGRPMATSVGLATYFAEHNQGAYHNLFMSFSERPQLVSLQGNSLCERLRNVERTSWGMNTNLEAAFEQVLQVAIKTHATHDEMPKAIVVISDMEIDYCSNVRNWNFYDTMKARFESEGYEIPNIIFWNVASRHDVFHAFSDYKGVMLCSGQGVSTFKAILQNLNKTPYQAMIDVLNADTYNRVVI